MKVKGDSDTSVNTFKARLVRKVSLAIRITDTCIQSSTFNLKEKVDTYTDVV